MIGEPFQVLDGGGQQELVLGAGETSQSEPDHRVDMLGLAKQRFDLFAFTAGDAVGLGLHQSTGVIPCRLVDVT